MISSWLPTDGRDHVLYVNDDDDLQQLLFSSNGTFTERTVMTDVGPWGFQVCSKNAGERGVVFWDMNDIKWATLTNSSPSLDYTQTVSTERLSVLACGDFDGNGQGEILATKRFSSDDVYRLYWLERAAGRAAFSQHLLYEGSRSVEDVRPVDVDGDGDKDLLVALRGSEVGAYTWERMLYENNGANHFLQTSLNYNCRTMPYFMGVLGRTSMVIICPKQSGMARRPSTSLVSSGTIIVLRITTQTKQT